MDTATFSAVASIASALAVVGGFAWTLYRARTTQHRRVSRDSFAELERVIDVLRGELARKEEEISYYRRQNEWLQRRTSKLLQAVSRAYNIPEAVIDMQLNGGPPPPEVRH